MSRAQVRHYAAVFFDLDGTLLDSMSEVLRTLNVLFSSYGACVLTLETFCAKFKMPFRAFCLSQGVEASCVDEILRRWGEEYNFRASVLFPDASVVVKSLVEHGFIVGIISGSARNVIEYHVSQNKLDAHITFYHGGDGEKTPHMLRFCDEYGVRPETVVYVGDTASDMEHALEAGLVPVGIVRSATVSSGHLKAAGAVFVMSSLIELLPYLRVQARY